MMEKAMLKKLKDGYDPEFSVGDEMFKDMALSRDKMREFHSKLDQDSPAHKLSVMVLQQSAWPFTARVSKVDLPPVMQDQLTKYVAFHKKKHEGHKLDWNHALGTVSLNARFEGGKKEFMVSLYQGVILLLFNDADELSLEEIAEQTGIDDPELRRTLQSLACGKKKVLKKLPPGKDVEDTDRFVFNAGFKDPLSKVHINSIQVKETVEETRRTQISIEGDRKYTLDAAIVRIMKSRKELPYEKLIAATIDAIKSHFTPEVGDIKHRVDGLVEQEYLRRGDVDRSLLIYVA